MFQVTRIPKRYRAGRVNSQWPELQSRRALWLGLRTQAAEYQRPLHCDLTCLVVTSDSGRWLGKLPSGETTDLPVSHVEESAKGHAAASQLTRDLRNVRVAWAVS